MKNVVIAGLFLLANTAAAEDSCEAQIPGSLGHAIGESFPTFRAPLATDNLPEDIEWNLEDGGKGCLGVAIADFDGDGARDVLLGLTPVQGTGGLVVVALARGQAWQLHALSEWPGNRVRLYVAAAEPGLYERAETLDGPLAEGEVRSLTCPHAAAILGATESSAVAYCYSDQNWRHVRTSD